MEAEIVSERDFVLPTGFAETSFVEPSVAGLDSLFSNGTKGCAMTLVNEAMGCDCGCGCCLIGESGCAKVSCLRMTWACVYDLEERRPDEGEVGEKK